MLQRLPHLLLAAALVFALGGPAGLLHRAVAHGAHGHAHASAADNHDHPVPAPGEPAAPRDSDCVTCHLLARADATPPALAAALVPRTATPAAEVSPPEVRLAVTRDRPPGRAPPTGHA